MLDKWFPLTTVVVSVHLGHQGGHLARCLVRRPGSQAGLPGTFGLAVKSYVCFCKHMSLLDFPIRTDSLYPHSLYPPVCSRTMESTDKCMRMDARTDNGRHTNACVSCAEASVYVHAWHVPFHRMMHWIRQHGSVHLLRGITCLKPLV